MILRVIPLVSKSIRQTTAKMPVRRLRIIRVITIGLAREQHVKAVVNIVVPLRVVQRHPALLIAVQIARTVIPIFED